MFLNNIELDVTTKCIGQNLSQHQVAESVGASGTYISRRINHPEKNVNQAFFQ